MIHRPPAGTALAVGEQVPTWSSVDQHGAPIGSQELAGRAALMVFYPFAFTGICSGELDELQGSLDEIDSAGVTLIGLSCDTMYTQRVFSEHRNLRMPLVADHWPHGAIASAFGVFDAQAGCAVRASFLIDGDGTVVWQVVNDIGERRDITDHVTAVRDWAARSRP